MKQRWKTLAQRIHMEIAEIDQAANNAICHWQRYQEDTDDREAFLNSVALNLHSFYNGIERILELIAMELDDGTLGGEAWHAELLRQMQLELPSVRPAVLTRESGCTLDEYRKFRHLVRHIYANRLDARRIAPLIKQLPTIWQEVKQQLIDFADFLSLLGD